MGAFRTTYPYERKAHPRRNFFWVKLILVVGVSIWAINAWIDGTSRISVTSPEYPLRFEVSPGQTLEETMANLGVNVSETRFKLYKKTYLETYRLNIGQYLLEWPTTLSGLIFDTLQHPESSEISMKILPGWNIWDIDALMVKNGLATNGEFVKYAQNKEKIQALTEVYPWLKGAESLEGYFLPDTYRVRPDLGMEKAAERALQAFHEKVYKGFPALRGTSLQETVILASIVEREERDNANKPTVAGIFENRLRLRMPLGADATVCYPYKITHDQCTPSFIGAHIADKNAYNTRTKAGLPSTAIASPSLETIEATISPRITDYLFYLHGRDGKIYYGRTLEEHIANKRFL